MHQLIEKFIENAGVVGISDRALELAISSCDQKEEYCRFFGSVKNFLPELESHITQMAIQNADLKLEGISGKVQALIWNRLMVYSEFKNFRDFLKAKFVFAAKPQNLIFAKKQNWKIADDIWYAVGDLSADFSFYTKRIILCALHSAIMCKFKSDWSHNFEDTEKFLQNRIQNIKDFTRFKFKIKEIKPNERVTIEKGCDLHKKGF